jgi:flagellar motor switch/type III secretory pathway protein FliN
MGHSVTKQSDQVIHDLLAAARCSAPAGGELPVPEDYDWDHPCRFPSPQLEKLGEFVARAEARMSEVLGARFGEGATLRADPPSQHYAGRLALPEGETPTYYVSLLRDNVTPCGLVMVSGELAQHWVAKALGGAATGQRDLSSLESALLWDVVAALAGAFSEVFQESGGVEVQCARDIATTPQLDEADGVGEYCVFGFRADEQAEQAAISFILTSDMLDATVSDGAGVAPALSPAEGRENVLASIGEVPVAAEVHLGTIDLTMHDVVTLEVGDVLMTDKTIDEPVEFLVGGKPVLWGFPVRCQGQYAFQVGVDPGSTQGRNQQE